MSSHPSSWLLLISKAGKMDVPPPPDEESEISESEIDDYSENPYRKLQTGHYMVKKVNGTLRCPFCSGKKKQDYKYKELMAHASGVSKGSVSRSAKQKANHLALAKYLETELAGGDHAEPIPPDSQWNLPTFGNNNNPCIWQFNFREFDLKTDVYAAENIYMRFGWSLSYFG